MKQFFKQFFQKTLPSGIRYILSWRWVKQFLYWLIISAGTIAECCFLIASLWMSVNSSVHPMILTLMAEKQSVQISYLASTIFTALPELIVAMALVTTINHCKDIRFQKDKWHTFVWPILFGLPTLVFLFISVLTVSCSVLKVNYVMPDWGIVARALSGYVFAVVYLLYEKLGEPCYADERKNLEIALTQKQAELEQTIADQKAEMARTKKHFEDALQTANSSFQIAMQSKQAEFEYRVNEIVEQGKSRIGDLQNLLEAKDVQVQKLSERASSLVAQGLENYPKVLSELVSQGVK
ncbi:MAG TPA: hypothetical protein VHV10_10050, partial [Ktedonobacteraceae bacterium]|nr:hypothetical protein [Ktedonobacteraceae bacterium]